ncbi:hypothetical protein Baya_7646 [Bagarius yarrelli]|uniref:Uncharacterized protein n=1 Tax=Bagarius yarrelli TaxID=175774 RepID=A0A556U3U2_BAGYA|nr:hypothetical protein Baya_7646 [Bagarius yarrelli]
MLVVVDLRLLAYAACQSRLPQNMNIKACALMDNLDTRGLSSNNEAGKKRNGGSKSDGEEIMADAISSKIKNRDGERGRPELRSDLLSCLEEKSERCPVTAHYPEKQS